MSNSNVEVNENDNTVKTENGIKLNLKRKHLYQLSRIFGKLDIELGLTSFEEYEVGEKIILKTLGNLWKAENEIDSLLAEITNTEIETIIDMDMNEYLDLWKGLIDNSGFKSFFTMASNLMKQKK